MPGVDDRVGWQRAQPVLDRGENRREVGERPAGRSRTPLEQRVAGEQRPQLRCVEAGGSGGVAGGGDGAQLHAAGCEHLAVPQGPEGLVRVSHLPQHGVGGVQQHRRVEVRAELRGDGDVIVVAVGAHHRHHVPTADRVLDGLCVVGRVDDDHLGVIPDQPDVVVHLPAAAVECEGPVGHHAGDAVPTLGVHRGICVHHTTTERSTSPECILWNASSTPSRGMRSETNFSSGRRPWR